MKLNDPLDLFALKLFGLGVSISIDGYHTEPGNFIPDQAILRFELTFAIVELRREWTLLRRK